MRKRILLQQSSKHDICNGEAVKSTACMSASDHSPEQTEHNKSMVTRSGPGQVLGGEETCSENLDTEEGRRTRLEARHQVNVRFVRETAQ